MTALFSLGFLFGTGGGAAYAVTKGSGNNKLAQSIYTLSILMTVATGLVILILGTILMGLIDTINCKC